MDNTDVKTVLDFLTSHPTLESVNAEVLQAENNAKRKIKEIEDFSKTLGVDVSINHREIIKREIYKKTGLSLSAGNFYRFEWHTLFYAVRESVWDYYSYLYAEDKSDGTIVKMNKVHLFGYEDDISKYVYREYANGKALYWNIDEMKERIEIIKAISEYFNERGIR